MRDMMPGLLTQSQRIVQKIALGLFAAAALAMIGLSLAAAFGRIAWPDLALSFGGAPVEGAGMYAQLALTGFLTALLFFLPANARMLRLENSHREFRVRMDDVARAYRLAHEDDRKKLFRIGSEFDSVRDRLLHLRDHPDLGALEPEVLELAAQMSHQARRLADIYSDEKVARARTFLRQRQEEVEKAQETLNMARRVVEDIKHWMLQVETEENIVAGQMKALEADLIGLLPELGYEIGIEERPTKAAPAAPGRDIVVPMEARPRPRPRRRGRLNPESGTEMG